MLSAFTADLVVLVQKENLMKLAEFACRSQIAFAGRAVTPVIALSLTACASVPNVNLSYQPVTWAIGASVVHTITCARDGKQTIISRDATFTPIYKADRKAPPLVLRLKDLDRFFADSDLTMSYTDDGRLKSINQSTLGQGEAITKALVGTVTTISSMGVAKSSLYSLDLPPLPASSRAESVYLLSEGKIKESTGPATAQGICGVVKKWTKATHKELPQISVIFAQPISMSLPMAEQGSIPPEPVDEQAKALIADLADIGLHLTARIAYEFSNSIGMAQPVGTHDLRADEVGLTLQQTRGLALSAYAKNDRGQEEKVSAATVVVPRPISEGALVLPIPKPALFGKQTFTLTLADSGRISSIGYGRTSGAAGGLSAATAVAGEQTAEDSAKAAALKAAADVIAQQTRTNGCVLKSSDCK